MRRNDEHNLIEFDSITQLASYANHTVPTHTRNRPSHPDAWSGGIVWSETMAKCAVGDDGAVPDARKLIEQLEASLSVSTTAYESSVAGCFPNVPEYLAGEPECMFEVTRVDSDTAPLAIYIDMTTGSNVTPGQYRKRGIAVLALAMMLSTVRPISLHVCTTVAAENGRTELMKKNRESYSVITARVETAPLDLARAAFMLTNVAVPRQPFYAIADHEHGHSHRFAEFKDVAYGDISCDKYAKRVADILNLDAETLYIRPVPWYGTHDSKEMVERPVEWLNKMLKQYGGIDAE
jgi:hypothetical protein